LFLYLAGQLVAGLVMFEIMLGLDKGPALMITTLVLLVYVTLGGAHADIVTDAFQGVVMLLIAAGVLLMFLTGFGIEGGLGGVLQRLESIDPHTMSWFHPTMQIVGSPWAIIAIIIAHIPLGMLPHIGNKLWALKADAARRQFLWIAFFFCSIVAGDILGWFARPSPSWRWTA
jgi:sodium/proline symporter